MTGERRVLGADFRVLGGRASVVWRRMSPFWRMLLLTCSTQGEIAAGARLEDRADAGALRMGMPDWRLLLCSS